MKIHPYIKEIQEKYFKMQSKVMSEICATLDLHFYKGNYDVLLNKIDYKNSKVQTAKICLPKSRFEEAKANFECMKDLSEWYKNNFYYTENNYCTDCKHFLSCESPKQVFHKSSGIECDEFEKPLTKDENSATITNDR